jgi:hypothetical protein
MPIKFPSNHDRLAVIGRTGSGKTQAAAWHLSGKHFFPNRLGQPYQPWVIVNTKGDPLLNEIADIKGVQRLELDETPGDKGLYIVSPLPDQGEELDAFFGRIWEKQNIGVYIDEGYMIDKTDKMNALLTQGRSRNIPMIILSQRPSWISKFVFSEADFFQLFHLQNEDDRKNIAKSIPFDTNSRLPRYHSYWYNAGDNEIVQFAPVPSRATILESFRQAFPPVASPDNDIPAPDQLPPGNPEALPARRKVV